MPDLVVTDSHGHRSTLRLRPGERYGVGREEDNEVVLIDPTLSRHHAVFYEESGAWMVSDCGSSNGTFLNDAQVSAPARLNPGDRVAVGACTLRFAPAADAADPVSFSDRPLAQEGTMVISLEDVHAEMRAATLDPATARAALTAMRRRMEIVERANLELLAHEPLDRLLPKILELVFEAIRPARAALLCLDAEGELHCKAFRASGSQGMTISRTVARKVLEERNSILTADAEHDDRLGGGSSVLGVGSMMAVPLWNNSEVIGLVYADSGGAARPFRPDDLKLLTMLANVAAIQIENARLFEEHIEIERFAQEAKAAAAVQERLLPADPPEIPGYRFHGKNLPCNEVGGDYYDCFPLREGKFGVVLADVSGKGMGAALLMAGLHCAVRARAEAAGSPVDLVARLDADILRSSPVGHFVTFFYVELDPATHVGRWVNAGHAPPPLAVRAAGGADELLPGGIPLGLPMPGQYPVREFVLQKGDFIFACSDGVSDVENPAGEIFGMDRLRELVSGLAGRSVEAIGATVEETLSAHAGPASRPDDLTYLVIQRTE